MNTSAGQRQISVLGPIYIRNKSVEVPIKRTLPEAAEEENKLDVTKYKIPTPNKTRRPIRNGTAKTDTYINTTVVSSNGNSCSEIQQRGQEKENIIGDEETKAVCQNLKNEEKQPADPRINIELETDTDAENMLHSFDNILIGDKEMKDLTFKISSTEDNYVQNIYKSKALLAQGKAQNTGENGQKSCECRRRENVHKHSKHKRSKSHDSSLVSPLNTPDTKHSSEGMDFLTRHRRRLAKLKRKFFESQPVSQPLPLPVAIDTCNSLEDIENLQSVDLEDLETVKTDDSHSIEPNSAFSPQNGPDENTQENEEPPERKEFERNACRGTGNQERRRRHSTYETSDRMTFEELRHRWSSTPQSEHFVVIAIDFGTTYSGYAYSFAHDPDTILLMRRHESGEPGIFDQKIPTTILLTPEGQFHSFGFQARDFYNDLDPKDATKWMYFDKFKMMLYNDGGLREDSVLRTISGKEVSALKVFSYSLAYFKDLATQEICDQSTLRVSNDVIRWVITVPAIWKASAKQFMRQAAYEAGIVPPNDPERLLIALEPEAASIYCRRLMSSASGNSPAKNVSSDISRASSLSLPELRSTEVSLVPNDLEKGTRYMVVDCGGGTVDITVHELVAGGRLRELQRASGGAHGSIGVDEEFERLLSFIFGAEIIQHFRRKRPAGWVDLMATFESRKRTASPYRQSSITVTLPFSFIEFFKKCRITYALNIGISYMFLAGGFAESSIIQHELRKDFGAILKIIIPREVSMAVLKGAVCFGMDPHVIYSRCSAMTYGVGVLHRYDVTKHPADKLITKDNMDWCTDVFDVFVRANQSVELGESISRRYTPVRRDQMATAISIYATESEGVMFITDPGVSLCGTLSLTFSENVPKGQRREIRTEMMFGDTEIRVRALDVADNNTVEAGIDFINY
ncbi:HS12A-like protein [Mya arenaria]|uniref:HS12A-like protein n=1 Tax=Mya arenaria TaxID=6604 RepID=A0ABY7FEW1_MYAAR|nr:HS12A-like protein [Mya arenaria]